MDLKEIGLEGMNWINVRTVVFWGITQHREERSSDQHCGGSLTSWINVDHDREKCWAVQNKESTFRLLE
jgi:hypothetical protein